MRVCVRVHVRVCEWVSGWVGGWVRVDLGGWVWMWIWVVVGVGVGGRVGGCGARVWCGVVWCDVCIISS